MAVRREGVSKIYKGVLRPLLFRLDPETAHHLALGVGGRALEIGPLREVARRAFELRDRRLETSHFGLRFKNPIGLAAGFDKDGIAFPLFSALGFGHIEIGTITAKPQSGNPRPRIFRYPSRLALVNRMGFPSSGADVAEARLRRLHGMKGDTVIGANIGKTKATPLDEAEADYLYSFRKVAPHVDYVALNVSSPNTPELRKLQEPDRLRRLLDAIGRENNRQVPILLKLSPDIPPADLEPVLDVIQSSSVAGVIATNTTVSRADLPEAEGVEGGVSGRPLRQRSLECIAALKERLGDRIPVVGVGGVFEASDALATLEQGAVLVQAYTALVYEGPFFVRTVLEGLVRALDERGLGSFDELRRALAHPAR